MKYFNRKFALRTVSLGAVLFLALLNSCTETPEDTQPTETTVEQDQLNIQQTFDDVLGCVDNFKKGNAIDVIFRDFLHLSNGDLLNDPWLEELTSDLESVINLDNIDANQRFDINFYAATYSYSIATKSWSKIGNQTNKVVFEFPSKPSATTNNASLVIENYVDKKVTIDTQAIYLPTSFDVVFSVDATVVTEINLNSVQYASNLDFEIPTAIDLTIFLDPMNISLVVSRDSPTNFKVEFSAINEGVCNISLAAAVDLKHDDYENLKEDDIKNITIEVVFNDLKIQSLSGIAELIKIEDPTENDINTTLDMEVLFKDVKIADLEWDEANDAIFIIYKDGSKEDSAIYHESFFNDLEDFMAEFFG